jgi:formylglycine-generating enzyme required for sulfatase activity
MIMNNLLVLASALALAACVPAVDYGGTDYMCLDGVTCPEGYTCVDERCVIGGGGDGDDDAGGGDGDDPDAGDDEDDEDAGEDVEPGELVSVPEITFFMGCEDSGEGDGCPSDASPEHEVTVSAFEIEETEVTQAAYAACVDAGACEPPSAFDPGVEPDVPVTAVSWYDAVDYCEWIDRRLPTEAEWEAAARGSFDRTYPWGEDEPDCDYAHYDACSPARTIAAGQPDGDVTPLGVRGLAGNVSEWVQDWYSGSYYDESPDEDPTGPDDGGERVIRGASYDVEEQDLPAWMRDQDPPQEQDVEVGFRCAR